MEGLMEEGCFEKVFVGAAETAEESQVVDDEEEAEGWVTGLFVVVAVV